MLAAYLVMGGPACLGILHIEDRRVQLAPERARAAILWIRTSGLGTRQSTDRREALAGRMRRLPGTHARRRRHASAPGAVVFSHDPSSCRATMVLAIRMISERYGCDFGIVDVTTTCGPQTRPKLEQVIGGWRMSPDRHRLLPSR